MPWERELVTALEHSRPTLRWLPTHLRSLLPEKRSDGHLLQLTSDLCDAGHVHLDIMLWVLGPRDLAAVLVGEEHYDRGPEDVETTFETTLNRHPLDTIAGVQLATATHPDGHQIDVSLAVMLSSGGFTGHADPMGYDDEVPSYALTTQPASLTFTTDAHRTGELVAFAEALLGARDRVRRTPPVR